MPTIHTVGDSHCYNGWRGVVTHHLGPLLCYTFGNQPFARCDLRHFGLQHGDSIVFCLGEIDCRCHVHKHVSDHCSYTQVIDALIERYLLAIDMQLRALAEKQPLLQLHRVGVFNVVPPVRRLDVWENPEYPYLGTDEERLAYVRYFNQQLALACLRKQFLFVDVYEQYADPQGFLRSDASDGNVHIKLATPLLQFIHTHFR